MQTAVPDSLRTQVWDGFHEILDYLQFYKTYNTITNYHYWKGCYANLQKHLCTRPNVVTETTTLSRPATRTIM